MVIDVLIVLLAAAMAVWGYSRGLTPRLLIAVAFGIGAVLGSRIAPQVLAGGLHDPFAPILALPGALLLGALLAAGMERAGFRLRRLLLGRDTVDALGGAVLGAFVGIVLAWAIAAAGARSDGLEGTVRSSNVVDGLNSVLPPPGPVLTAKRPEPPSGPPRAKPRETPHELRVKQDPEVRASARSAVKIAVSSCEGRGAASGWIAGDGIVMTNAHVVHSSTRLGVKIEGKGRPHDAEPIYYATDEDIAILRVPEVRGHPWLRIQTKHRVGASVAVQGFPFGKRFKTRAARLGPIIDIKPEENVTRTRPSAVMRSGLGLGQGSSGGPVVDRKGRVMAMLFAGSPLDRRRNQFVIPGFELRRALRHAVAHPRPVDTGGCHR